MVSLEFSPSLVCHSSPSSFCHCERPARQASAGGSAAISEIASADQSQPRKDRGGGIGEPGPKRKRGCNVAFICVHVLE
jgi:hypothetical protein